MENNDEGLDVNARLVFDMNLALYLDLIAVLEKSGVVTYRQMAARVLNISIDAKEDGDHNLATALEGVAKGFAGQDGGLSIGLLKTAGDLRNDEALGDIPMRPDEL